MNTIKIFFKIRNKPKSSLTVILVQVLTQSMDLTNDLYPLFILTLWPRLWCSVFELYVLFLIYLPPNGFTCQPVKQVRLLPSSCFPRKKVSFQLLELFDKKMFDVFATCFYLDSSNFSAFIQGSIYLPILFMTHGLLWYILLEAHKISKDNYYVLRQVPCYTNVWQCR